MPVNDIAIWATIAATMAASAAFGRAGKTAAAQSPAKIFNAPKISAKDESPINETNDEARFGPTEKNILENVPLSTSTAAMRIIPCRSFFGLIDGEQMFNGAAEPVLRRADHAPTAFAISQTVQGRPIAYDGPDAGWYLQHVMYFGQLEEIT